MMVVSIVYVKCFCFIMCIFDTCSAIHFRAVVILQVNGCLRQEGNTKDMIFSIITLVEYLSLYFTLETGDVVLTGTPSGIGPTVPGDSIQCGLGDILSMQFSVCSEH